MAVVPSVPGQYNTFIPSTEATNGMVVDFSKNVSKFALPRYVQYVPVSLNQGLYMRMTVEQAGRILGTAELEEYAWADGADAPEGNDGRESFGYHPFRTSRKAYAYRLGQLAVEQAPWDVMAQHGRIHAQKAMTARTMAVYSALTTTGNWDSTHVLANPESISGVTGRLDQSSTARCDIQRTFNHMFSLINKDTLDAVDPSQVHIVVGPGFAQKIAVCQEIKDYIKGSPSAEKDIRMGLGKNARYGLPDTLYGYNLEIETAVRTTSAKGATTAKSYIWGEDDVLMVSRPGELEAVEGSPSFSTVQLFLKEDMTVETKYDSDNRVNKGRVVDDWDVKIVAPISGVYLQNALA